MHVNAVWHTLANSLPQSGSSSSLEDYILYSETCIKRPRLGWSLNIIGGKLHDKTTIGT